jgi:hypothetical protein
MSKSPVVKEYKEEDVLGIECKHVCFSKGIPRDRGEIPDDLVFIKEVVHLKDGQLIPNTRMIKNFKRPFWITKPGYQNHEEKKEWEDIDKLDKFESTQAGMEMAIKRALNIRSPVWGLKRLARSPYLYGADIPSTAIIKRHYMERYPECVSENRVAVLDIETDVNSIEHNGDPIYVAVTFKDKAVMAVTDKFLDQCEGWDLPNDQFPEAMKKYFHERLPELIKERNMDLEVVHTPTPLEAVEHVIGRCHEWMPDFLSIWNINFDIPKILAAIEKWGGDPEAIFSDPKVPKAFRRCWYKEGPAKKVTANGREEALHWVDRWHTLYCPASFWVVDQAAVFRKLRIANGREASYALDAVLKKYAGTKKLKNEKADTMTGLEWHQYMQKKEPLEYGVYNIYDCVSCEILDENPKIGDLRQSISMQCGHSDYDKFPSQPRRTVDDLHYACLRLKKVIATTPDNLKTDFDAMTTSIRNWIVTLPAHLVVDNGLNLIEEVPELKTLIRAAVYDLDVAAAYPNGESILNCSKATTVAEVVKIKGVDEHTQRMASINLTGGTINATEIMVSVCKAPTFSELLEDFEKNELEGS